MLPVRKMFDASVLPAVIPAGYEIAAGYIGGDTPHVWTEQEWRRVSHLKRLPIWVYDPRSGNPDEDAVEAFLSLYRLGATVGAPLALDMETHVDKEYVIRFSSLIKWARLRCWVYGSADTVFGNPSADGFWVGDWTGTPHMHGGGVATQYARGNEYDSSVVEGWAYLHELWAGPIVTRSLPDRDHTVTGNCRPARTQTANVPHIRHLSERPDHEYRSSPRPGDSRASRPSPDRNRPDGAPLRYRRPDRPAA